MAINYHKCPRCGSLNTVQLSGGLPADEEEQIKLGGCCLTGPDAEYCCKDCQNEWDRQTAIGNAYTAIKGIKASVGEYSGGFYDVELDFQTRKLKWRHSVGGDENDDNKTISQSSLNTFIEELKMADLLNWDSDYIQPGVCGGIQWSLDIKSAEGNIWIYGTNKFPNQWDQFCEAIRKISGKEFR